MNRRIVGLALALYLPAPLASAIEVRNIIGAGVVPSSMTNGEIVINRTDGLFFYKNEAGAITATSMLRASTVGKTAITAVNAAALATAAGLGTADSPTFAGLTVNGQVSIKASSQYTGSAILNSLGQPIVSFIGTTSTNDNGLISLANNSSVGVQLWANGTSFINGGNFGIGTASPGAKLDVVGTMRGQMLSLGAAPTATNIPASYWTVVKRTDDGSVKVCANDAGTIKCAVMN